jgi:hypothetical protein
VFFHLRRWSPMPHPRSSAHPRLCRFHARKEAQAQAVESIGRDISARLSGSYLSTCDLRSALGDVFTGVAQGSIRPRGSSSGRHITPFRINTCESVSKQMTLSPFRINTYEKPGEGVARALQGRNPLPSLRHRFLASPRVTGAVSERA